jgi:hypothetical protein
MQEPSDEMLMALADNELSPEEAVSLHARIAADPELAARYAAYVESRAALQAAFAADDPVPEALLRTINETPIDTPRPSAEVVTLRPRAAAFEWPRALAASLLVAVALGGVLAGRGLAPEAALSDPARLAAADLGQALTGADVALAGGASARVLGSYDTQYGLCRLIELRLVPSGSERAVVCRDAGEWSVVAAIATGTESSYVTASDTAAALIDEVLDDLGAGPALDPAAEAEALAR